MSNQQLPQVGERVAFFYPDHPSAVKLHSGQIESVRSSWFTIGSQRFERCAVQGWVTVS